MYRYTGVDEETNIHTPYDLTTCIIAENNLGHVKQQQQRETFNNIFCIHHIGVQASQRETRWMEVKARQLREGFLKLGPLCLRGPMKNWQPAQDMGRDG